MAKGAKTAIKLSEWTCRQADSEAKWISATVPSNIHLELMKANMIPDPFIDLNEELVQWVGEVDWVFPDSWRPNLGIQNRFQWS